MSNDLKDGTVEQKIAELRSRGTELHHEEEVDLTSKDIEKLKVSIRNTIIFVLIVAIVGSGIVYFFSDGGTTPLIVLSLTMLVLIIMITASIVNLNGIIKKNKKMVIRGIITSERQERVGTGKSRRIRYYKMIGTRELQVDINLNKKYKPGDAVEIHYALNGKMLPYIFEDQLLEGGGISSVNLN